METKSSCHCHSNKLLQFNPRLRPVQPLRDVSIKQAAAFEPCRLFYRWSWLVSTQPFLCFQTYVSGRKITWFIIIYFNVLSGIVHVSVGKDVPNYFSWNEKLQLVRPTIRLHKTASLDFNWSIGLHLHFTAGCPSCHKQSLHSLCRMHGGAWRVYEPDITGQVNWTTGSFELKIFIQNKIILNYNSIKKSS